MEDLVVTGASGGIGRALVLELAGEGGRRLVLVARRVAALESLAEAVRERGGEARVVPGDLGTLGGSRELGARLADEVRPGVTLVHNAGVWPAKRQRGEDGLESAFVVNHLGPLAMQEPLLAAGLLRRVLVVGAGLMIKGRFDAERTPTGEDFSGLRTYPTTKLCFAVAMRDVAASHPEVDVLVVHPGVVRTELGARSGPLGWLLSAVKRGWEAPETCAQRLARILSQPRWSPPGEARWQVEEEPQPWPAIASDPPTVDAVRRATRRFLGDSFA